MYFLLGSPRALQCDIRMTLKTAREYEDVVEQMRQDVLLWRKRSERLKSIVVAKSGDSAVDLLSQKCSELMDTVSTCVHGRRPFIINAFFFA